ncbi:MAG TPA: dihydroneopterin aldolase [Candidatus Limnocylindrales bacterium]|nr:dihydroneopterin aldolase [Candidatus Limnocylindrales bacterium]
MTDRILLAGMAFQARHGVEDQEKLEPQRFEVDVELLLDLQPAGLEDDLGRTVDYAGVYATVRQIVESTSFNLIEAVAEAIAHEVLTGERRASEIVVRVRKPQVRLGGELAYAGVEIRRTRSA